MSPPGNSPNFSSIGNTTGYITEKMYVLLQLYLQNKSWNPSLELLQYFTELKETNMLPNVSYLQMLTKRIALNGQGRLIMRENGKLIIPFEQFGNAVMIKHLDGPHGVHLSIENTIKAVMEDFTVGREYFGMEKDFIIEMVKTCPNPTCRFYKTQIDLTQKPSSISSNYTQDSEKGTPGLLRSNLTDNSESLPTINISITTHLGSSEEDNRINNNQLLKGHFSAMKKVYAKLPDSTLIVLPSAELYKLDFRLNSEKSENLYHFQNSNSTKELKLLPNGIWTIDADLKSIHTTVCDGQEKIVRAFAEVMKNMSRMKSCVRPAMCKPYGKQSETLQKTLVDTIQLIQSLRSFLPPPHIPVTSWKNEDNKHVLEHSSISYLSCL